MDVIVNVDDGGLHPAVRRAVVSLSQKGIVTSTTLMANGPDFDNAAKIRDVGLGVHLNILRGKPILESTCLASLTGDDGLFLGSYGKLFKRYVTGGLSHDEIRKEWSAQIEKVLDHGVTPTHFDSEKHIHAWPTLMTIATELADKYGVKWVRRPHQPKGFFEPGSGGVRLKFLAVCSWFQRNRKGVQWPDAVWGIADQGHELLPAAFESYARKLGIQGAVVEICCHPGISEQGDAPISEDYGPMRVDRQWKAEYDALSDPSWHAALKRIGARLKNYGQVG